MAHSAHYPRSAHYRGVEQALLQRQAHVASLSMQNARAARVVAAQSRSRDECIELLAMLGLRPGTSGSTGSPV